MVGRELVIVADAQLCFSFAADRRVRLPDVRRQFVCF
jgi:hypothetical protein